MQRESEPLLLRRLAGRPETTDPQARGDDVEAGRGGAGAEAGGAAVAGGRAHLSSSSSSDEFFDCDDTLPGGGKSR